MSQQPPGDPAARRQQPRQGAAGDGERTRPAADPATRQRQAPTDRPGGDPTRPAGARSSSAGRAVGPVYGAGQPRAADPAGAPTRQADGGPRGDRPTQRSEPLPDLGVPSDPFAFDPGAESRPRDRYAAPARDDGTPRRSAARDPYADPYSMPDPFSDPGVDADEGAFDRPPRAPRPARSARPAAPDPDDPTDPSAWGDEFDDPFDETGWDDPADEGAAVARRSRPARRQAPRRRAARPAVALPSFRMPSALVSGDLVGDRVAFALFAASLAGALLMAIVLLTQVGRLPAALVVHLDAAGIPDRWGTPRVLWRLPLIDIGVSLMNAVVAWYAARLDRFAARFVLAAVLVVQLITWAALFSLL